MNYKNLKISIIAAYVAFSGIFWLPSVSSGLISYFKYSAYLLLSILGIIGYKKISKNVASLIWGLLLCATVSLISSILYFEPEEAIESARSFFEPMLWLIAMSTITQINFGYFIHQFEKVFLPVGFLYGIPVLVFLGVVPNIYPQGQYASAVLGSLDSEFQLEQLSVAYSGFTGSRVGWGIVVATSILFYLAARDYQKKERRHDLAIAIAAVGGGVISIMSTGARGGVFVLSMFGAWAIFRQIKNSANKFISIFLLLSFFSITLFLVTPYLSIPENYFRGFEFGGNAEETVNSITTGRLDTIIKSLEKLQTSPWFGLGVEGAKVRLGDVGNDTYLSPHNVWVRILCERGLIAIFPVIYITILIIKNAKRAQSTIYQKPHDFGLVVYAGILIGLTEPAAIFGSLNTNLPFWTAVYICAKFR